MHRMRFVRHGRYDIPNRDPVEKLLNFIHKEPGGCWNYTGYTNSDGYGHVVIRGKHYKASRISYEHFVGKIPYGLFILHKCDNPSCVNPDHLYAGTQKENVCDMFERGRSRSQRQARAGDNK